ncbi:MAG: phage holin family protein [Anaerolineae bacterium]|nr:phage holin family protein [Anaerolineae bacterium]
MTRLVISLLINAIALVVAEFLIEGIWIVGEPRWAVVAVLAVIFGLVNALIRPLVKFLTCLINIFTLGLFTLVINALMLLLTGWIARALDLGFYVDGFVPAFLGALLISIVSWVLSLVLREPDDKRRKPKTRTETRRDRW